MKWMIASDIHGSEYYCRLLIERFRESRSDKLVLLGDLLYHGPRNDLPRDYSTRGTASLLNTAARDILCVRGNCDAEIDQALLGFPILAEYAVIAEQEKLLYLTHGHHACEEEPLPMSEGAYLVCGHTHLPGLRRHADFTYMNPGSVSIPKEGTPHSCMLLDGEVLSWIDIETGETFLTEAFL